MFLDNFISIPFPIVVTTIMCYKSVSFNPYEEQQQDGCRYLASCFCYVMY